MALYNEKETINKMGGSPGLVVMGRGSCSESCEFESRSCKLDGHDIFSHRFVVKNVAMFV